MKPHFWGRVRRWFWIHSPLWDADEIAARRSHAAHCDHARALARAFQAQASEQPIVRRERPWLDRWRSDSELVSGPTEEGPRTFVPDISTPPRRQRRVVFVRGAGGAMVPQLEILIDGQWVRVRNDVQR